MKIRSVIMGLLLIVGVTAVQAQYRTPKNNVDSFDRQNAKFEDHLYFGGNGTLGSSFGTFYAVLYPQVGYKFTDNFSTGLQLTYQYARNADLGFSTSNFGGGPFAMYAVGGYFLLYSQVEYLNYGAFNSNLETIRMNSRSWYAGIGWISSLGNNFSFQILGLYDLVWGTGENSFYDSPFQIRAGFVYDF